MESTAIIAATSAPPSPAPPTHVPPPQTSPTAVPTATQPPEITAEPSDVPIKLCTPLAEHPLEELPEILSNPFQAPRPGRDDGHHGADFSYYTRGERVSMQGVPVQSILPGRVVGVTDDRPPYGFLVIVETSLESTPAGLVDSLGLMPGQALYTLFAHLEERAQVRLGQQVSCGQVLGAVGNTGWSGNPHLHLETRSGPAGAVFKAMAFYDTRATQEEMDNYRRWRMSGEFQPFDPLFLLSY